MLLINQLIESSKFALHALQNNKLRTFLSLLGVTIGIFAIILVYSVVDSLEANIRGSINRLGDNIVYVQKWPFGGGGEYAWWKYLNRPEPTMKDARELEKRLTKAEHVLFVFGTTATAKYRSNSVENVKVVGAGHAFKALWNFNLASGRYLTLQEAESGKPYCIIGLSVAEGLFGSQDPLGKTIKVMGRKLTIIGTFEKTGKTIVGQNYDQMVQVPAEYLRRLVNPNFTQGTAIVIKAKPKVSVAELKDEVRGYTRSIHRLKPKTEDDFALNEISVLSAGLDGVFKIIGIAGTFIGGFSILVGGFGIANIMFVSVKERTTEIGIQKALGAKNRFILIQFLLESIVLCLLGGVAGLLLLVPVIALAAKLSEFTIFLSSANIIIGISLSLAIGIVSGAFPAIMASRMAPVDAIRSKQ
jgi:putative ABC transport system permease protein